MSAEHIWILLLKIPLSGKYSLSEIECMMSEKLGSWQVIMNVGKRGKALDKTDGYIV